MADVSVIFATVAEIIGDFGFKRFADTNLLGGFLQGLVGYVGVIFFLIRSFRSANVLYVNGLWDGISGLVESLAAIIFLGDRLEFIQYVGIGVIMLGLFLLKMVPGTGVQASPK